MAVKGEGVMYQANKFLYDEISRLPFEKVGKALSYVRYLQKETEDELFISEEEEAELHELRQSDEFISSDEMLAKIIGLSDD
jgi:vancomycin permeability regulator SanA